MTQRDRTALAVLAALGAIVGAWFVFIAPQRSEANRLGARIAAAQSQLRFELGIVAAGQTARRQYATYSAELARLDQAVPADDDVPPLIIQLQRAADQAGVDFRSLVLQSTGTTVPAPATGTSPASSPAPGSASAAAALPPGVTIGAAGLPQEPFSFTFTGSYFRLADFLGRVQRFVIARGDSVAVSGRLMTLNSVSLAAGPDGFPQITATINATTYLVPSTPATEVATGASTTVQPTAGPAGGTVPPEAAATVTP